MEVRVSGHQVDTGDALQTHVEDRMNAIASKYFPKAISASVTVSKAPHAHFKCDMRRLNDHHVQAQYAAKQEDAAYRVFDSFEEEDESEQDGDSPPIIAETSTDIPEASVSNAVMMMDLRNTSALLFKNSGTGIHNMVYRRSDGTIGWVEPHS